MNGRLRGNQATSRALNRHFVLSLLLERGPLSRAELSEISGLSAATITFVVAELIHETFLDECEPEPGAQGRRPIPVRIDPDRRLFAGVAIGRQGIECGLTNLLGVQQEHRRCAEVADTTGTIATSLATIDEMLSSMGHDAACLAGIGIAVDAECQSIDIATVRKSLEKHFRQAVRVEAAVDAFAVSQSLFGHGRQRNSLAAICVGDRLESSLVSGGELFARRRPGVRPGKVKSHDHRGQKSMLEETSSFSAMTAHWSGGSARTPDANAFLSAIRRGDPDAMSIARRAAERIGRHLRDVIAFADPETITIGGEGALLGDDFVKSIREAAASDLPFPPPEIVAAWQPEDSARCAASVAALNFFGRPRTLGE